MEGFLHKPFTQVKSCHKKEYAYFSPSLFIKNIANIFLDNLIYEVCDKLLS